MRALQHYSAAQNHVNLLPPPIQFSEVRIALGEPSIKIDIQTYCNISFTPDIFVILLERQSIFLIYDLLIIPKS
jgi:hypothetical protein